jgi:hypothetical protein
MGVYETGASPECRLKPLQFDEWFDNWGGRLIFGERWEPESPVARRTLAVLCHCAESFCDESPERGGDAGTQ